MKIAWTSAAWADVDRLHAFLVAQDLDSADALLDRLAGAPEKLLDFPRRGPRLSRYDPREVRELRVSRYVLRYEVIGAQIVVLRYFHARENRG
jgi:plasmid stabilization system protein ParE